MTSYACPAAALRRRRTGPAARRRDIAWCRRIPRLRQRRCTRRPVIVPPCRTGSAQCRRRRVMTLAWITQVKNDSAAALTLLQNDPSKHPVCNGHQYQQDEPIRVPPGATMDFSWFVIPWRDYGRLLVRGPGGEVVWQVGPFEGGDTDVLQGR